MEISAQDERVILTGATGRLGRVIGRHYAEAGASIAAVARERDKAEALDHLSADRHHIFAGDLTREEEVQSCFQAIDQVFGSPTTLIHTVGAWGKTPLVETDRDEWSWMMDVNLTSTWLCFRETVRLMRNDSRSGVLIGFASRQGADRGEPGQAAYSAAKAGVVRLVESITVEHKEDDIAAYALAPSFIAYDEDAEQGVHAEDVARTCRFLTTSDDGASRGETIRLYGPSRRLK